jgi:hypothetical protein
VNTGSGGGGTNAGTGDPVAGSGGSGTVILKYVDTKTATFSGGVTQTTTSAGGYKISVVTAAGASDTVSWA